MSTTKCSVSCISGVTHGSIKHGQSVWSGSSELSSSRGIGQKKKYTISNYIRFWSNSRSINLCATLHQSSRHLDWRPMPWDGGKLQTVGLFSRQCPTLEHRSAWPQLTWCQGTLCKRTLQAEQAVDSCPLRSIPSRALVNSICPHNLQKGAGQSRGGRWLHLARWRNR